MLAYGTERNGIGITKDERTIIVCSVVQAGLPKTQIQNHVFPLSIHQHQPSHGATTPLLPADDLT